MHGTTLLVTQWDTNPYLHGTLIGINLLLFISLLLRFEWPLIRRKFTKTDEIDTSVSINAEREQHRTNAMYASSHSQLNGNDTEEVILGNTQAAEAVPASTGNTLGIEIITSPSTPGSATPTPIPKTPENNPYHTAAAGHANTKYHDNTLSVNRASRSFQETNPFPLFADSDSTHLPNLAPLPSGSKIREIELAKVHSGRNVEIDTIPEEKYQQYAEMARVNQAIADDAFGHLNSSSKPATATEGVSSRRRRITIEFYQQLFNPNNFDNNGKLLTPRKRKKLRAKMARNKRRMHARNDSANLLQHQRGFNGQVFYEDDVMDVFDETEVSSYNNAGPHINYGYYDEKHSPHTAAVNNNHLLNNKNYNQYHIDYLEVLEANSLQNLNVKHEFSLTQLLNSKIYDDENKQTVRNRYRYILYFPMLVFMVMGMMCVVLSSLRDGDEQIYSLIVYAYPVLQIVLSIVLWCQIDIVILSCGGAHIVEECLEVQISANGHEYKCIYCCWCNCAVLRFCNWCTHDNGYSLFKCHHQFLKMLICIICPLLSTLYFVISEVHVIREALFHATIGTISDNDASPQWIRDINGAAVFWLIFAIISLFYIICIFTATSIGVLIMSSLRFVSSLSPKTLIMQYVTSVVITFVMQIQFIILLLVYNLSNTEETHSSGLCQVTAFYLLLVYVEFIAVSIFNHFSFQNSDFVRFGKDSIEKNEVQLFDFLPDYHNIHDLHNYRRVFGEHFLFDVDAKKTKGLRALSGVDTTRTNMTEDGEEEEEEDEEEEEEDEDNLQEDQHRPARDKKVKHKKASKKKNKIPGTPLITQHGLIHVPNTKPRKKQHSKNKKRTSSKHVLRKKSSKASVEDEPVTKTETDKEQKHNEKPQPQRVPDGNHTESRKSEKQIVQHVENEKEQHVHRDATEDEEAESIRLESVIDDEIDGDRKIKSRPGSTSTKNDSQHSNIISNNIISMAMDAGDRSDRDEFYNPKLDKVVLSRIDSSQAQPDHAATNSKQQSNMDSQHNQNTPNNASNNESHYHHSNSQTTQSLNATFTQTTVKETTHRYPTTTTSLSLDMNTDGFVPPYSDVGHEADSSSTYSADQEENSWANSDENDNVSSPSEKVKKRSKKKHHHNESNKSSTTKLKSVKLKDRAKKKEKARTHQAAKASHSNNKHEQINTNDAKAAGNSSSGSSSSSSSSIANSKTALKHKENAAHAAVLDDDGDNDDAKLVRMDTEAP